MVAVVFIPYFYNYTVQLARIICYIPVFYRSPNLHPTLTAFGWVISTEGNYPVPKILGSYGLNENLDIGVI